MDKFCTEKCNKNTCLCISMKKEQKRIAVYSGPNGGKTTMLDAVAVKGITVIPEAARIIIEEEKWKDSDCLPWRDLYKFQVAVAKRIMELEHSFDDTVLACDRGLVDCHGYALNGRVQTPDLVAEYGHGRYVLVCCLDLIPNYKKDSARWESPEMGRRIHGSLQRGYSEYGYRSLRIPVMGSPEKRADYFVKLVERIV